MIIKASSRGGARQLAAHLNNQEDNQHVELFDLRGFVANDLDGALLEMHSVSKATNCKQFMFSICLSPPPDEDVPHHAFENALNRIESEFGMENQPRALVFHEKEARRHLHAVYSRIDAEEMKAVNLPFYKNKLFNISREMFLEQGWKMPKGYLNTVERDPSNFSLQEYQQAKRAGRDPKSIKAAFQEAWNQSDNSTAFKNALEESGYHLARGDRRGFVAIDYTGEIYSVARWAGQKTREVKDRLGDPELLPSTDETKALISEKMRPALRRMLAECDHKYSEQKKALDEKRALMTAMHKVEREKLEAQLFERETIENKERMQRLRSGVKGIWDRLQGTYQRTRKQNEVELAECKIRDEIEKKKMRDNHLRQQKQFRTYVQNARSTHTLEITTLMRDIKRYQRSSHSDLFEDGNGYEHRQDHTFEFEI